MNKTLIKFGAGIGIVLITGYVILLFSQFLNQRQKIAPRAQVVEPLVCPPGGVPVEPSSACPSGWTIVPVYPSGTQQGGAIVPTTGIIDGGGDTGPGLIAPTDSGFDLISTPGTPIGFCCIPIVTPGPTDSIATPVIPIPTETPFPTPTVCVPQSIIIVDSINCGTVNRCDFSVQDDGGGSITVRSLWADGTFDSGTGTTVDSAKLAAQTFNYPTSGDYQVNLQCVDEFNVALGTCTKTISVLSGDILCPSLTPTTPVIDTPIPTHTDIPPSPTPTGGACRIPNVKIEFRCPVPGSC